MACKLLTRTLCSSDRRPVTGYQPTSGRL